jgi:hypothetical protein
MDYITQTNAVTPYLCFASAYFVAIFLPREYRDRAGLCLVLALCAALGLRDIPGMPIGQDPVIYASILSNDVDVQTVATGIDYALFILLHRVTSQLFNLQWCFFLLHMLFIPFLLMLYRRLKRLGGVFFLMAGWLMFVNSGLLLLANFFRQGMSVLLLLVLCIPAVATTATSRRGRKLAVFLMPLFHLASAGLIPVLLFVKKRWYYLAAGICMFSLCLFIHAGPAAVTSHFGDYFGNPDTDAQQGQIWAKVIGLYSILAVGMLLTMRVTKMRSDLKQIRRAAIGFMLPSASLLLMLDEPAIGLRFMYYIYALAFLYLACSIKASKSELTFKAAALGTCLFGWITWTYPTVARVLVW